MRLLILGLDNAGKTTILRKVSKMMTAEAAKARKAEAGEPAAAPATEKVEGAVADDQSIGTIEPTLGFNIQTLEHPRGYRVNVWDVGGQECIRAYWRNYFEQTDGVIWVVDSADVDDPHRLEACRDELHRLLGQERLMGASLLVLANKQDVPGARSCSEIARLLRLEGENASPALRNRHWNIMPCSAVTGKGLLEGVEWMVSDIASRIFLLS
jgi:ADP-ribosylation factor-like protein 2